MSSLDCRVHKFIAGVALLAEDGVLLVKYGSAPDRQRGWLLPHDLMGHLEHPDAAVRRVLRDQLGLCDVVAELSHIESFKGNDTSWHLAFHYAARLNLTPRLSPTPDLIDVAWFPLDALPDRDDVAHRGWALDTIADVLRRGEQPVALAG